MKNINNLNKKFELNEATCQLQFINGKGDIPVIEVKNKLASAKISLQGAHLLSWIPQAEDEVIWVSTDAKFSQGKSVRGGIPICWPWFGAHESAKSFPAHGFARTVYWRVTATQQLSSGETQIGFVLDCAALDPALHVMWPKENTAEYIITIGASLTLELKTHNKTQNEVVLGEALHTYFNVGNVNQVTVSGLDEKTYLDKPDMFKRKKQSGNILIKGEVDRVYLQTVDDVVIQNNQRKIIISKQGSQSTVVWNPWKQVADKMADLGEDGYLKMLCVESANAAQNVVKLAAGESHSLIVNYRIEKN